MNKSVIEEEQLKFMKLDTLRNKIKKLRNGTFFHIRYMSQMKVAAEYAHNGIQIIKVVDTTSRTGVNYGKIKGVVSKYPDEYTPKKPTAWSWIIPHKLKYNDNTKKEYLCLYPIHKLPHRVKYLLINKDLAVTTYNNIEDISHYLQPSQLTRSKSGGKTINIELSNILQID